MEAYINDIGKRCFKGVELFTPFDSSLFHEVERGANGYNDDICFALHTNLGSLTVVDRMTGFGHRDTESGYRDPEGRFWLASGMFDVRGCDCETIGEAIEWVKKNANNAIGYLRQPKIKKKDQTNV